MCGYTILVVKIEMKSKFSETIYSLKLGGCVTPFIQVNDYSNARMISNEGIMGCHHLAARVAGHFR